MKSKGLIFSLIFCILFGGFTSACGGGTASPKGSGQSTNQPGTSGGGGSGGGTGGGTTPAATIASVEITTNPQSLLPGEDLQLVAVAKDSQGNVLGSATITFSGNGPHVAVVSNDGLVEVKYPGQVSFTAEAGGLTSAPFQLTVDPVDNTQTVSQLTDNNLDDSWGMNNFWKMTSRRRVFWVQDNMGGNETLFLADEDGNIEFQQAPNAGSDFLALGSGDGPDDVMIIDFKFIINTSLLWIKMS